MKKNIIIVLLSMAAIFSLVVTNTNVSAQQFDIPQQEHEINPGFTPDSLEIPENQGTVYTQCTDPNNAFICEAETRAALSNPDNNKWKEKQWDPPVIPPHSYIKCVAQAKNMVGVSGFADVIRYCDGLSMVCASYGLSYVECYAYTMVAPNVQIPSEISQSITEKVDANIAAGGGDARLQTQSEGPPQ